VEIEYILCKINIQLNSATLIFYTMNLPSFFYIINIVLAISQSALQRTESTLTIFLKSILNTCLCN